jgi:ribosomal protein S18 acetylase RimI-like enzyme
MCDAFQTLFQEQEWHDHRHLLLLSEFGVSVQAFIYNDPITIPTTDVKIRAYICSLYVNESVRGHNHGSWALETMENMLRNTYGVDTVEIDWDERDSDLWILEWYKRRGYEEVTQFTHGVALVKRF